MTREDITALIRRRQEAMEHRDVDALTGLYASTCVVESPTAGGPVSGRAAVAQTYEAWFRAFPDLTMTFDEPLIDGDRVAQTITAMGTDTGGFLGMPPTGKRFRIPTMFLTKVKDHQIVQERRVYDFTGMLMQIGVLRAKPA